MQTQTLELCTAADAIMHLLPKQTDEHNSLSALYQLLQPRPDTNAPTAALYDYKETKQKKVVSELPRNPLPLHRKEREDFGHLPLMVVMTTTKKLLLL